MAYNALNSEALCRGHMKIHEHFHDNMITLLGWIWLQMGSGINGILL